MGRFAEVLTLTDKFLVINLPINPELLKFN